MKPLLTLCMMVKDEAHTIARTLQSAKPWIDRWCILDTGSTDGTQQVIRDVMLEEPHASLGSVHSAPFVDFATSRNRLLDIAAASSETGTFLLLLDADDILDGGEALRAFLESDHGAPSAHSCTKLNGERPCKACHWKPDEAFYLRMRQGSCVWPSARVVRADAGWRYVGAVHEVLCHPERPAPSITIPGVTIRHEQSTPDRQRARWERDLDLLRPDAVKNDPRAVYYYALTLLRLGRSGEAFDWFARRMALGGYWQERYDSAFERARISDRTGNVPNFVTGMLDAHSIDPRRAEPLVALAEHYLKSNPPGFGPAFTFALRAFDLAQHVPDDALFLHADVYEWRAASVLGWAAFYVGAFDIGERAARIALERGPEHLREHHAKNLSYYTERKR